MQTDIDPHRPSIKRARSRSQSGLLPILTLAGALFPCAACEGRRDSASGQVPRAPRQVIGFVGDGAAAVTDKFNTTMLVSIGNHAAPAVIQNLVPETDPDYSRGRWVVRRVAKLDGRLDGRGYSIARQELDLGAWLSRRAAALMQPTSGLNGEALPFTWWAPDASAMLHADAEQLRETLLRDLANGASGRNVWEIANEPNYFPSITPEQYATLFVEYASFIRAVDPGARIVVGSLWSPELVTDQAAFRRLAAQAATARLAAASSAAPLPAAVLALLGAEVGNLFADRVLGFGGSAVTYLTAVLNAIPDDLAQRIGPVDVSFHAFPFDPGTPVAERLLSKIINTTAVDVAAEVSRYNRRAQPVGSRRNALVYVTEYGNVVSARTEAEVLARVQAMTENFVANANIEAAFFFKAMGIDPAIASFLGGSPPLSRVIADPDYVLPSPGDSANPFPCAALNSLGHWFQAYLNGVDCVDVGGGLPGAP